MELNSRRFRQKLATKLMILSLGAMVLLAAALCIVVILDLRSALERQAIEREGVNMGVAWEVVHSVGTDFVVHDGQLLVGDTVLNDNTAVVDRIQALVGGTATIFLGDLRIATNVKTSDGRRAVGTRLAAGPVHDAVIGQHRSYLGTADILGRSYYTRYDPILDKSGSVIGVLFVGLPQSDFLAIVDRLTNRIIVFAAIVTLVLGTPLFLVLRGDLRALNQVQQALQAVSRGSLSADVPHLSRADEIGAMATAVQVFKDNAVERATLRRAHEEEQQRAAQERAQSMTAVSDTFETTVNAKVAAVAQVSQDINDTAMAMAQRSQTSGGRSLKVGEAAAISTERAADAADATRQLSQAVDEIARQVAHSGDVSGQAVDEVNAMAQRMGGLTEAVKTIGAVVKLINDIASQTNLLALNATIEAARAGDAGKGFAVVAGEVKNLANQTAKATDDIARQISAVQGSTEEMAASIEAVVGTIHSLDTISAAIAEAVRQQEGMTRSIADNIEAVAEQARAVSASVSTLSRSSAQACAGTVRVVWSADDLKTAVQELHAEAATFIDHVRQ
jgi:methyl-accepting chemotaxis protein